MRARRIRRRDLRLPAAIVVAVLAGELAVWALRPSPDLHPEQVSPSGYFSKSELARASDYAGLQRTLGIGGLLAEGAVLVLAVVIPPRRAISAAERLTRGRPLAAGAIVGSGIAATVTLAGLPFAAVAHQHSVDFGLATQSWGGWLEDVAKSTSIGLVLSGAGAALALGLMRRLGRRWWIAAAAAVVAFEVVFVWLAPVVIAPLFNKYDKLPAGRTRDQLIELARDHGIKVNEILVVDASRRTRTVNAYVTGIGHTKRIVLYDTLLERYTPQQVRLVVAHELGHVKAHDVQRGLLWVALFTLPAMYLISVLAQRWATRAGARSGVPASLPALALALAVVSAGGVVISNQLSRSVEARADEFALEATGEPEQFVQLERRLALSNLTEPNPPRLLHELLGTHPTTTERIGAARAYERERSGTDRRR